MGIDLRIECDECPAERILPDTCDGDWSLDANWSPQAVMDHEGWTYRWVSGRWRVSCPRCAKKAAEGEAVQSFVDYLADYGISGPRDPGRPRSGFTLVEVLVVLAVVAIVAAVTVPTILSWRSAGAVQSAAERLQAALVAAREAAAEDRAVRGLRIVPDASWALSRRADGTIDGSKALAGGRVVPLASPPGYTDGLATIDVGPLPPGFSKPAAVLMLEQSPADRAGNLAMPTAWAWNARVGDRVQVGGQGGDYWVVGPETIANPERFVNYGASGPDLDRGDGLGKREYLWLVNGRDDDGDGRGDPGFNGVDEDGDQVVDDGDEWAEVEAWLPAHKGGVKASPYALFRRPAPTSGPTIDLGPAVVDLTGWGLEAPPRSRVPVDPRTGVVELLVHPDGRVEPAIVASNPAWIGLRGDWIHLWIADRGDVQDSPRLEGSARLLSIQGKTGRAVATEVDPADPPAAFDRAEGRR